MLQGLHLVNDDECINYCHPVNQNVRCKSVFRQVRHSCMSCGGEEECVSQFGSPLNFSNQDTYILIKALANGHSTQNNSLSSFFLHAVFFLLGIITKPGSRNHVVDTSVILVPDCWISPRLSFCLICKKRRERSSFFHKELKCSAELHLSHKWYFAVIASLSETKCILTEHATCGQDPDDLNQDK